MRQCFYDVNKLLEPVLANAKTGKHCGSTAVVCFIQDRKIYVGNVGDSRAVLSRKGKPVRLSFDHKPYSQEEEDRVRSFGSFFFFSLLSFFFSYCCLHSCFRGLYYW